MNLQAGEPAKLTRHGGTVMLMRRDALPVVLRNRVQGEGRPGTWFEEIFEDLFSDSETRFFPGLNVSETDDAFEVSVELPGMSKEEFEISLEENVLTISGERKIRQEEEEGRKFHRVESRYGRFSRSLPLPNVVDRDGVTAKYDNGVLHIRIPKSEEKAARKIEIS
ncbi:MAG: Hsp20/alpha crystallin family protein [Bacteroidota bacterium]